MIAIPVRADAIRCSLLAVRNREFYMGWECSATHTYDTCSLNLLDNSLWLKVALGYKGVGAVYSLALKTS